MKTLFAKKRMLTMVLTAMLLLIAIPGAAWAYSTAYPNTWKNTGNQANDIVQIALTQVGYTETSSNHTKYAAWYYGADKSVPWCSIFISWCANQAGVSTNTITKNALASGYSTSNMSRNSFGAPAYAFGSTKAKPGDIIYVDSNGDGVSNHTGLVYAVDDSYIYTVEGNYSSNVSKVKYSAASGHRLLASRASSAHIVFYARPNYANSSSSSSENSGNTSGSYSTGTYTITAGSLNIRSGAGLDYKILGELHKGDVIKVTKVSERWGAFDYKGQTAWTSLAYASLTESTASTTAGSSESTSGSSTESYSTGTYTITAANLNVRKAPDTTSAILGVVTEGTVVTVTKTSGRFGFIQYKGQDAWVSLRYASLVKSSSGGSSSSSDGNYSTGTWQVNTDSLYVRSGPDTTTEMLGVVKQGDTFSVSETNGRFGKISYKGKTAWISLKYCTKK